MSFYNTLAYAVSGLDITATEILHTFTRYVLGKFPHNTFKTGSVFIDSLGTVTDHKRRTNGLESPKIVQKPYVIVTNDGGLTDAWNKDDGGPDIRQYSMFPGTTTDRRIKNNHRLTFITDKTTGVHVDTIELRRKLELDFKFDFDSKADLSTIRSHLYTNLSIKKQSILKNIKTTLVLPTVLIHDLSKLLYNANEFSVSNMTDVDKLINFLNIGPSAYNLYYRKKDVNPDDLLFFIDREIGINFFITDMDGKDGSNNEKDGEVYDKFSLNLHCSLDFKLPNSYILNYKAFNAPNKSVISSEYLNNVKLDDNAMIPATFSEMKYIEDREYIRPVNNGYELCVREEFLIENEKEIVQLSDFFPPDTIYREILYRLTPIERRDMFEVQIYENSVIIEDFNIHIFDIESDIVYIIDKCNTNVSFMIFIYCNKEKLKKYSTIIQNRIEKSIFPNVGENNIPYFVGTIPPRELNIIPPFQEWDNSTEYQINSFVIYNNHLYKAIDISTNIIPNEDNTKWKFILKFWNNTETYSVDDYVIYKSMLYRALVENTNIKPSINYDTYRFVKLLGEDYASNFTLPLISTQTAIGGKFLKGGVKLHNSKKANTIETFNCSIFAVR